MTTTENSENTKAEGTTPAAPEEPAPAAETVVEHTAPRQPREGKGPASADGDRPDRNRRGGGRGVRVDGNLEKAIRQFRKRIERQGLFRELRKRRFFEKPSERRKRKQREAEKRRRKKSRRD